MPTVTETLASMRDDILARLPDPKAEGEGDNSNPTPAPEPEKKEEEPATDPDIASRVKALEEKCSALEDRIKAIEDAAAKAEEPAAEPEKKEEEEQPAALKQLLALLKNPVVVQALSAGEDRSRASAPAPDTPPAGILEQYLALPRGSAESAAFFRDHRAEITAAANARNR